MKIGWGLKSEWRQGRPASDSCRGSRGHEDDAGVSQNSDLAILLGSVTEKEYHNAKNILLCLESRGRMELRGTLLLLLLH